MWVCLNYLEQYGHDIQLFFGKRDLVSAFRILPILPKHRCLLLMKAQHPLSKLWKYFINKCLPFGSSISCTHFQLFSDALAHIVQQKLGLKVVNYLDDFLFINPQQEICDQMVRKFLDICEQVHCPVSAEKTEWSSNVMIFLGILLDGVNCCLAIPQDKRMKAITMIQMVQEKRTVTVKTVQRLTGLLNFFTESSCPRKNIHVKNV